MESRESLLPVEYFFFVIKIREKKMSYRKFEDPISAEQYVQQKEEN